MNSQLHGSSHFPSPLIAEWTSDYLFEFHNSQVTIGFEKPLKNIKWCPLEKGMVKIIQMQLLI